MPVPGMLSRDDFFAELSRLSSQLAAGKKMGLILARVQRLGEVNIIMDKELVDAAQARIERSLRTGDRVAKIGACDFIIFLADLKNVNHAALAANSLVRGFQEPLLVSVGPVQTTIAMGVSIFPDHGDEPEILCKHAEIAFGRALHSSDRYALYDSHEEKIKILYPEFREAITNNRLEVYLQPFWDLRKKKVIGADTTHVWVRKP